MQGLRQRVSRILIHLDFILSKVIKPLAIYLAFLSLLYAAIAYYLPTTWVILPLLFLMLLFFPLTIAFAIEGLIDEIVSGRTELYLVAGLTRTQYVTAWIMAIILFPIVGFILSTTIPILITAPDIIIQNINLITEPVRMSVLGLFVTLITQLYNNTAIMVFVGLASRRKGIVFLMAIILSFILPLAVSIMTAFNPYIVHLLMFTSPLYYATWSALPQIPKAPLWIAIVFSFTIAMIFTIQSIVLAKKALEA